MWPHPKWPKMFSVHTHKVRKRQQNVKVLVFSASVMSVFFFLRQSYPKTRRLNAQHGHDCSGCVHLPAHHHRLPGPQVPALPLSITKVRRNVYWLFIHVFVSEHLFLQVTSYVYLYAHDINKLIAVQDRHHFKHSECYQPIKAVATCSYYYNK